MNDGLKLLISLSISASIIAIFLFALKFLIKDKLSKTWQYYIWLIVILRLLLPFSIPTNIVGELFSKTQTYNFNNEIINNNTQIINNNTQITNNNTEITNSTNKYYPNTVYSKDTKFYNNQIENSTSTVKNYFNILIDNMLIISLFISILLLVKKITSYKSFINYIKAGRRNINDEEILELLESICDELRLKKTPELYSNKMVSSSMLVGIINPFIVIPETQLLTKENLKYIFFHELTHLKRYDIIYKWLVQITICIHWFNPLLYFVKREINNLCELACDEAVIKNFDNNNKISYGDTLISSLELGGIYSNEIVSLTLCQNGKLLKERLRAIMKFGKKSKITVLISIILTVTFCMGAVVTGAYDSNIVKSNEAVVMETYNNNIVKSNSIDKFTYEVDEIAGTYFDEIDDINKLSYIAYYMSTDEVDKIAKTYVNKTGDIYKLGSIVYYMSTDAVDEIAKTYFNKIDDIENFNIEKFNSIAYYMSTDAVDEIAKTYLNRTGDIDKLNSIAYYMSTEVVDEIAKTYFNKTGDIKKLNSIGYYMSTDAIDEIAKTYLNKTGDMLSYIDYNSNNNGAIWEGNPLKMDELTPNVVKHIKTISQTDADKISEVYIDAYNCGILIEKSENKDFEFDYVGVKDESICDIKISINGGTKLNINAKFNGSIKTISTSGNNIVNTIRIKVPEKEYSNFFVKIDGAINLPNLQSNVKVESEDGVIKVSDKIITSPLELITNDGVIKISAQTITSPVTIKNDDGVTMVDVEELKNDMNIGGNKNKNTDGVVKFNFLRKPENIHLILNTSDGVVKLPNGWTREIVRGNGKPVVTILNEDGVTEIISN